MIAGLDNQERKRGDDGMRMRGTVFHLALLCAAMLVSRSAAAQDTVPSLYDAAKKEGKLVFLSSQDVKTNDAIAAKFNAIYPGIQVQSFKIEPGPAIERIVTESQAGRMSADDVDTSLAYTPQLFDRGLVEAYPWEKVFGLDPELVMFDDRAVVQLNLDVPIVYNTDMVKTGEIKSWDDLAAAKYRGKLILEARGLAFQLLAVKWGEARSFDYLGKLLANQPIIIKGGTPTIEALAGGQGAVAIGTYGGRAIQFAEQGAPVDWARVGPIPAMTYVVMPLKGAPHPNAARLWAAFYTTREAQEALYAGMRFGMLTGKETDPHGMEIRKAGLDIIHEPPSIAENQRLLEKAGAAIGGLK
jgi:iron(III) transport system substrate-binding protein